MRIVVTHRIHFDKIFSYIYGFVDLSNYFNLFPQNIPHETGRCGAAACSMSTLKGKLKQRPFDLYVPNR